MGLNWGGFAQGFSGGFQNGIQIGKAIDGAIKQKKLEDVRAQGIAEANAMRDKEIDSAVRENPVEGATQATQATSQPELNSTPQASPAPAEKPQSETVTTSPVDVPTQESISTPAPLPTSSTPQASAATTPSATGSLGATPQSTPAPEVLPKEVPPAPSSPAAQGISGAAPKKRFEVNGKGFDTREEALAFAKQSAPSIMDYMGKTLVPKMQELLVAQGDIEKAEAWGKWAKERKNQRTMETWGKAYTAAQRGDFETAANGVFELYKQYDDGVTPISKETVKDKDGNVTGFNVKLRDDATGEERSQFVGQQELLNMGMQALSPAALFEQAYKKQAEAEKMSAEARIKGQQETTRFNNDMKLRTYTADRDDRRQGIKAKQEAERDERLHGYELEKIVTREDLERNGYGMKERAKLQAEIDIARENGLQESEVKDFVRMKMGGGYKKTTDPQERRALVVSDLMKNDMDFSRASPEEQAKKVDRMLGLIYSDQKPAAGNTTVPNPTAPQKAPPGVKDGKYMVNGQPVEVRNGEIIPLQKK